MARRTAVAMADTAHVVSDDKTCPGCRETRATASREFARRLSFTVSAVPVPKARPRFSRTGHTYTPSATRDYERLVQAAAIEAAIPFGRLPVFEAGTLVELEVRVYRAANRGDLDNYLKAISDACNRVVWSDDKQIVSVLAWMGVDKANPRVEVCVEAV